MNLFTWKLNGHNTTFTMRIDDHFIAHWLVEINDVAKEFTYEEWIEHGEKWIRHVAPKQDLSVAS